VFEEYRTGFTGELSESEAPNFVILLNVKFRKHVVKNI